MARERKIVQWLHNIAVDATQLYLVGDIFDFWFEYRRVIPKGFVRLQGAIADLCDSGLPVFLFTGNHDLWQENYLVEELGVRALYRQPIQATLYGKRCMIGHGDGLGPGDYGYKRLKMLFTNPWAKAAFRWLHPDIGVGVAKYWSHRSRRTQGFHPVACEAPEQEWLFQYAERKLMHHPDLEYFIFGHRHVALDYTLSNGVSRYVNLGEWLRQCTYAVLSSDGSLTLRSY
jgi:UDP-2,3-diacylglucosamine hydrolase